MDSWLVEIRLNSELLQRSSSSRGHLVSWIGWQCIQNSVIIELNSFVAFSAAGALFIQKGISLIWLIG
jgi:hypothetical protein